MYKMYQMKDKFSFGNFIDWKRAETFAGKNGTFLNWK